MMPVIQLFEDQVFSHFPTCLPYIIAVSDIHIYIDIHSDNAAQLDASC